MEIEASEALTPDRVTLGEAGETYLAHIESRRNLKRATLQDYWRYLRRHLTGPQAPVKQGTRPVRNAPFFAHRTLASITRADVNRYVDQKVAEGLAPRTLDSHLTFLSAVCTYAVEQSWIEKNPVVGVERPRPDDPTRSRTGRVTRTRWKKSPLSCACVPTSNGRCSRRRTTPACASVSCSP